MEHVFISYSRKDSEFVNLLVDELRHHSHGVWLDTNDIRGGTDWAEEIEKAIELSYAFLLISSKDSLKSEWVNKEIKLAKKNKNKIPIMPLLIDKTTIPNYLARSQSIDFSSMLEGNDVDTIRSYRRGVRQLIQSLELARPMLRYLKQLNHSNGEKREEAARQLGNLGDQGAVEQLIQRLKDMDADVRYEAALALGKLKVSNAFKPLVRLLKEDEDPDVVAASATALGALGMIEAVVPLGLKLKDPDRFVRACAVRALGNLKNVSSVNVLVNILRTDGISDVRDAARDALENIGGRQADRALRRIAQSDLLGRKKTKDKK